MTRHRTLDETEQVPDHPWGPRRRWRMGSIPAPGTGPDDHPIGAQGRCWCGVEYPHDWPGRADGQPHPREEPRRP